MHYLSKIFRNHLITRVFSVLALVFILYLGSRLSKGQSQFIEFLQTWKWPAIVSFFCLMIHVALELKTALDDYIPNLKNRAIVTRILLVILCLVLVVVCVFMGQM